MSAYLQANSIGEHSCQQALAGVIDLLYIAQIDLYHALTLSVSPTTFECGKVVRRERSRENESSSASVAERFDSKHDKLSVGALCRVVGDPGHVL
jgi:hypothetical protein